MPKPRPSRTTASNSSLHASALRCPSDGAPGVCPCPECCGCAGVPTAITTSVTTAPKRRARMRRPISAELGQVRADGRTLALAKRHGDVQLLEVLGQDLPAELRLLGREERLHVGFELLRGETG